MHQHNNHSPAHDDDDAPPALNAVDAPLDAAGQSLAEALRASFGILKIIMFVLFVLYLFSNVRRIESHEQAMTLRLGALQPGVKEAGLVWAFPFPIDEIITLPTRKSNDLVIDSQTFHRRPNEVGRDLSRISRGSSQGLNPALDGALLTADAGLVHIRWKVTYKIDDVAKYITNIYGRRIEAAEQLIQRTVEKAGVLVASELTADEVIRTRVDWVQREMIRLVNQQLTGIDSGIVVTRVEMSERTVPIPVRGAFDGTQVAENFKQKRIRDAEQERTRILSEAAGSSYSVLLNVLDKIDRRKAESESVDDLRKRLDWLFENDAEGEAGRRIKNAGTYLSRVVGQIQSDVELYRTLLPEFERNPALLVARLWEKTREEIFDNDGVTKFYRPAGAQIRLHIPLDAEEQRHAEERRLQSKEFDASKLRPTKWVPVGPEAE